MSELEKIIAQIAKNSIQKIIISKPQEKSNPYKKIVMERKKDYFQAAKYTEKQVFHDNVEPKALEQYLLDTILDVYLQVNAWDDEKEHILLLSKKGSITYKTKKLQTAIATTEVSEHNRQKNYILKEGEIIPPLVDMGVFTKEGKVVKSMYDKFR